jgi:hypothetical protein
LSTPGIPQNFNVQTGNQQALVTWNLSVGATTYQVNKSLDNVTYSVLATITGSPLATSYLDTTTPLGTQVWYTVQASSDGVTFSAATNPQSIIPAPAGEEALSTIRLQAMQRADRVNSNFVTMPEWNLYINKAMYELYDMLVTTYEDYFLATPVQFSVNGSQFLYPVPDGTLTFQNALTLQQFIPPALYKLYGVDLALQTANNAYVTINRFNFIDRNRFVFPNTASTIYGVFNMQYRLMGSNIEFIPTPSAGQVIRIWYVPRLTTLLQDTDTTTLGVSGWTEYVIVRAAKYALDKEESDTSKLDVELVALTERIISSASYRDQGQPDKISDTRSNNGWGGSGNTGFNGGFGGF